MNNFRAINPHKLIYDLGLSEARVVNNKGQRAVRARCPHPEHTDSTPSFTVNLEDQKYNCFGCSLGGVGIKQLFRQVSMPSPDWVDSLPVFVGKKIRKINMSKQNDVNIRDSWRQILSQNPEGARDKLAERGIKPRVIDLFEVGYNKDKDILFFPIFKNLNDDKTKLVGWSERSDNYKTRYKLMPEKVDKSSLLYGDWLLVEGNENNVYLVEGVVDCLKLWGWGFKALSTLGNVVYDKQAERIGDLASQVIVVPDSDRGGVRFKNTAAELLEGRVPLSCVNLPKEVKDAGDNNCTIDVFKRAVKNRVKLTRKIKSKTKSKK